MTSRRMVVALASLWTCTVLLTGTPANAQDQGWIEIPQSSQRPPKTTEQPNQQPGSKRSRGVAYTNIILKHYAGSAVPSSYSETPASVACIYGIVSQVSGCPISGTTQTPTGGSGTIAIVDAYDYPTAANDLAAFSSYYNLPSANFQVVYASGTQPATDSTGGWELEAALDIEWAHAMAPNASIVLVEAASNSTSDLDAAVQVASSYASQTGGEISMSWSSPESSGDPASNSLFTASNVVYLAATGDVAFEHSYPAMSPNVVAVGGTTINRDASGNFLNESYWDNGAGGGGGGISSYESIPSYQNGISSIVGTHRGTPDISALGDPYTGVAVYDTTPYKGTAPYWIQLGGTSVATPIMAARFNVVGEFSSVPALLTSLYNEYSSAYSTYFRDVTQGNANCAVGWDICSGIGTLTGSVFPVINASAQRLNFGTFQNSSSRPVSKTVSFTNPGSASITVNSVQLEGTDDPDDLFYITSDGCTGTLLGNSSCSVVVTYDPSNASGTGTHNIADALLLTSSGWNSPSQVGLTAIITCQPDGCSK